WDRTGERLSGVIAFPYSGQGRLSLRMWGQNHEEEWEGHPEYSAEPGAWIIVLADRGRIPTPPSVSEQQFGIGYLRSWLVPYTMRLRDQLDVDLPDGVSFETSDTTDKEGRVVRRYAFLMNQRVAREIS